MSFALKTRDRELDVGDKQLYLGLTAPLGVDEAYLYLGLHGGLVMEKNGLRTSKTLAGAPPAGLGRDHGTPARFRLSNSFSSVSAFSVLSVLRPTSSRLGDVETEWTT